MELIKTCNLDITDYTARIIDSRQEVMLRDVYVISDYHQSWWYEEGPWKGPRSAGGR
jgi:hypothetical protein